MFSFLFYILFFILAVFIILGAFSNISNSKEHSSISNIVITYLLISLVLIIITGIITIFCNNIGIGIVGIAKYNIFMLLTVYVSSLVGELYYFIKLDGKIDVATYIRYADRVQKIGSLNVISGMMIILSVIFVFYFDIYLT